VVVEGGPAGSASSRHHKAHIEAALSAIADGDLEKASLPVFVAAAARRPDRGLFNNSAHA